jgi:hypothetical protein
MKDMGMMSSQDGKGKARYGQLEGLRRPFLDRARAFSVLTIPYLQPPEGHTADSSLATPYQSVGGMGVSGLSSKLTLSVFPTNSVFFRLDIDDNTEEDLRKFAEEAGIEVTDISAEIRANLAKTERVAQKWTEGTALRVIAGNAFKHIINSGNYLLQCDFSKKDPIVRGFRLDQYVVNRSPQGDLLELYIREMVDPTTLPENVQAVLGLEENNSSDEPRLEEMYTCAKLKGNKYEMYQEIKGIVIPGSQGSYPKDLFPYIALTWERECSEMYGRSYIENLVGDLIACEGLSKAIYEASAVSAKVVFLVEPNSSTSIKALTEAKNGAVVRGSAKDVLALQVGKMADLQVAHTYLQEVTQRLQMAFIAQSSIQRQAERVTAEEIRMMSEMLDQQLGGVYSRFSRDLQTPLANLILRGLEKSKRIPAIPKGDIKVQIITGIDALGRGQELQALRGAVTDTMQLLGPEALEEMHKGELISRIFYGYGAKPEGVLKTPTEKAEEEKKNQEAQDQMQAMEMAKSAAPAVIKNQQQAL